MKDVLIACIDNLTDFAEAIIQNSVIQEMDATAPELGVTTGQLRIKFGERMPLAMQPELQGLCLKNSSQVYNLQNLKDYINTR